MNEEKVENKDINKNSLIIMAGIIIALVIAGWWYSTKRMKGEMENLREAHKIELELGEMSQQYDQISIQYEGFNFKVGNDSLLAMLTTEQSKVQQLMEELRTVKSTNTKRINELKKEIETLRRIMREYVVQIDSLNTANENLIKENSQLARTVRSERSRNEQLSQNLASQTEIVTRASRLDATAITVTPTNDKGKEVKKIKQMAQFAVNFHIAKNPTASTGEKTIYIRIKRPDDDILVKSRANVFPFEDKEIPYSMKRVIEYEGEELPVKMYWDIEEFLSPGAYRVDIFADGNLIGQKSFDLSDK